MKPIFLPKETRTAEESFFCRYAEVPHTYDKFHYHKEFELLYHIENRGTRFIGDSIRRFSSGDLVLVGPNIPHYWHSDDIYYQNNPDLSAKVVLFHFIKDFAGKEFFELPEMKAAKSLIERARHGVQVYGSKIKEIGPKIVDIINKSGWERIISLIAILNEMGEVDEFNLLASDGFCNSYYKNQNEEKITALYNFIFQNHSRQLSLEEVAHHVNMNMSAFCRFFKNVTNQTFSNALNELRIGISCRQLINTGLSVSEIGYNCGYQNISYYNRQFKRIKKMTPMEYRLKHLNNK